MSTTAKVRSAPGALELSGPGVVGVLGAAEHLVGAAPEAGLKGLSRAELTEVVDVASRVMAVMVSLQTRAAVEIDALGDGGLNAKTVLRESGRMSCRVANSIAKTASGLEQMPKFAESLATGRISAEHAAAAVAAAEKTSPAQVEQQLWEIAETSTPDNFSSAARLWSNRIHTEDSGDARETQRQLRSCKDWVNDQGMGVVLAELDPVAYQQVTSALAAEYDRLWRDDGGRDAKPNEVRTPPQRLADAFVSLITNPRRKRGPATPRMQLTAVVDLERLTGDNPIGVAEIIGGETLPQSVLERLACMSTITGVIFENGEPIWVGRDHRHATEAQIKALIARDRHCTGCAAAPERCEVHHIIPWQDDGPTDIDSLCLACPNCHHNIHDHGWIVIKTKDGFKIIDPNNPPRAGP